MSTLISIFAIDAEYLKAQPLRMDQAHSHMYTNETEKL